VASAVHRQKDLFFILTPPLPHPPSLLPPPLSCALPRRRDLPPEHGLLLVASAVHRQKDLFFILVQSEAGDLYKVTVTHEEDQVRMSDGSGGE
jgi:hypothetical protein